MTITERYLLKNILEKCLKNKLISTLYNGALKKIKKIKTN